MNSNKILKSALAACLSCVCLFGMCASADPATSFSEDFNSYKLHISYNGTGLNNIINSGKPVDGDYSNKTVYPNGEESIYEGNAANNLFVYDSKGNKVYGGIDGFVGYYKGDAGSYNKSNRRLTIRNDGKFAKNNVLGFETAKSSLDGFANFAKEDIDFSGVSIWETDAIIATPGSGTSDIFSTFTFSITKNPINSGYEYEMEIPIVEFATKDQAKDGKGEIRIFGKKVLDTKVISMYYDSKMYNVKYVLDNSGDIPMHWVVITYDGKVVASTVPAPFENYEEFFTEDAVYGILYTGRNAPEKLEPRYLIDNINFYKGTAPTVANYDDVTSAKYPTKDAQIKIKLDTVITDDISSSVTLTDAKGKAVTDGVSVVQEDKSIIVTASKLAPQEIYTVSLKNIPCDGGMYISKDIKIKTIESVSIVDAQRFGTAADIKLFNNTAEDKTFIVVLTISSGKKNVAGGIYYKAVKVLSGKTGEAVIEDISLDGIDQNDVTYNAFVIDDLTNLRSVADKCEF